MRLDLIAALALASVTEAAGISIDFTIANSYSQRQDKSVQRSIGKLHRQSSNKAVSDDGVQALNASLTTSYNFYHAQVLVGSPAQQLDMLLDTGSPVSWVYGPEGSFNNAPRFFPNESSSFSWLNSSFSAAYGSGNYLGHWGHDLIGTPILIGNDSLTNKTTMVPFDLGVVSSFAVAAGAPGLLGLGPHIDYAGPSTYRTLPEALYEQNYTSSPGFSIFLEGDGGKFLFGAVDVAQVNEPFWRYNIGSSSPIVSPQQQAQSQGWNVRLDSLSLNHGTAYPVSSNAILDTGSPVSLVPPGFVKQVGEAFGLSKNSDYDVYYTNATNANAITGWVTFQLGEFAVDVAANDLFVPGELIWLDDGPQNVTALSLMGSSETLLGDAFFRHVYTVMDGQNQEILLARRNLGVPKNESTVVPINSLTGIREGRTATLTTSIATQTLASVTGTAPLLQNMYLGTVDEKVATSMSGETTVKKAVATTASSAGSASASATTSAATSTSTSTKSANGASHVASGFLLSVLGIFLI